jgi:hypothetical protein
MKKNLFPALVVLLVSLLLSACKKNQNVSTTDSSKNLTEHGLGARQDKEAYKKLKVIDLDSLKTRLIALGKVSKHVKNDINNPPSSIILNNPDIGDQGATGTCVSWSVGHALMGTLNNEYPELNVPNPRSGWYIYQKDHSATGNCSADDGMTITSGLNISKYSGVPAASLDPDLGSPCAAPASYINADAATDRSSSYGALWGGLTDIKRALSMHIPVEMGFDVYTSFDNAFAFGTTMNTVSGNYRGRHAVVIIGYDDSKNAVLIQNSWGIYGGDPLKPGCMWIDYNTMNNSQLNVELYMATPGIVDQIPSQYSNVQLNYINGTVDASGSTLIAMNDSQPLLTVGSSIYSPNGNFRITLQTDGNFVLYKKNSNGTESGIWSSRTQGKAAASVYFQTDGNLVVYNANHTPLWASGIYYAGGNLHYAKYYLQNDGNFVLYWPAYYQTNPVTIIMACSDTAPGILSPHSGSLNHTLWGNNNNQVYGYSFN